MEIPFKNPTKFGFACSYSYRSRKASRDLSKRVSDVIGGSAANRRLTGLLGERWWYMPSVKLRTQTIFSSTKIIDE